MNNKLIIINNVIKLIIFKLNIYYWIRFLQIIYSFYQPIAFNNIPITWKVKIIAIEMLKECCTIADQCTKKWMEQ